MSHSCRSATWRSWWTACSLWREPTRADPAGGGALRLARAGLRGRRNREHSGRGAEALGAIGDSGPVGAAPGGPQPGAADRSEEHTSELQSQSNLVCRLLLEKKKKKIKTDTR